QADAIRGDTARALGYLERLLANYPNSDQLTLAHQWQARLKPAAAATKATATKSEVAKQSAAKANLAIQIGAFRDINGARAMKQQLERAGFSDVRLVRVPGNTLIRVRIGNYQNRTA